MEIKQPYVEPEMTIVVLQPEDTTNLTSVGIELPDDVWDLTR